MACIKTLLAAAALFLIASPHTGQAENYLLTLKNGNRILTNTFWTEDDQIMLDRFGGVIGFPRSEIRSITVAPPSTIISGPAVTIEESASPLLEEETTPVDEISSPGGAKTRGDITDEAPPPELTPEQIAAIRKEKEQLTQESEIATQLFAQAKKSPDPEARRAAMHNLISIRRKLDDLKRKAMKAYGGTLPEWWENE